MGRIASVRTMIPIPPSQCVVLRQKSKLLGRASMSERMLAPVVVKPDMDSKTVLIRLPNLENYFIN